MGSSDRSRRHRGRQRDRERENGQLKGDDFFQPVGIDGTFGRACTVFSRQWCLFLGINFITALVSYCAVLLTFIAFSETDLVTQQAGVAVLIEVLVISAIQCVGDAANIQGVAEVLVGSQPTITSCFGEALCNLCTLLSAAFTVGIWLIFTPGALLAWLVWDNGSFAAIVWSGLFYAIYVWFVLLLTYHVRSAILVESHGPLEAIARSMQLVRENFCYTFCMLLIWAAAKFLINMLVTSLANSDNPNNATSEDGSFQLDFTFGSTGDGIAPFVIGVFMSTFGSIFQAVIYFNNRVWTEDLTSEVVCSEMELEDFQTNYATMETSSSRRKRSETRAEV